MDISFEGKKELRKGNVVRLLLRIIMDDAHSNTLMRIMISANLLSLQGSVCISFWQTVPQTNVLQHLCNQLLARGPLGGGGSWHPRTLGVSPPVDSSLYRGLGRMCAMHSVPHFTFLSSLHTCLYSCWPPASTSTTDRLISRLHCV